MANLRGNSKAGGYAVITMQNLLQFIKLVDGHGSGVDADTLDGKHADYFSAGSHNHDSVYLKLAGGTMTGILNLNADQRWFTTGKYAMDLKNSDIKGLNSLIFKDPSEVDGVEGLAFPKTGKNDTSRIATDYDLVKALDGRLYLNSNWVLTNAMLGHKTDSSGIDADTVDGRHASEFLLLTGGSMTGDLTLNHGCNLVINQGAVQFKTTDLSNARGYGLSFYNQFGSSRMGGMGLYTTGTTIHYMYFSPKKDVPERADGLRILPQVGKNDLVYVMNNLANKVWHEANDGAGTGLDADLLDGKHADAFSLTSHNHDSVYLKLAGGTMTGPVIFQRDQFWLANGRYALDLNNSDVKGLNCLVFADSSETGEGLLFPKTGKNGSSQTNSDYDIVRALDGKLYLNSNWALTNAMLGHKTDSTGIDADKVDGLHAASFFRTDTHNSYNLAFGSGDGYGVRFWNSDLYSIYMSVATHATYGGRAPGETETDYNMYLKMGHTSGTSNRGFAFKSNNEVVAGINGKGDIFAKGSITAGNNKFKIEYNEGSETIDFIFK